MPVGNWTPENTMKFVLYVAAALGGSPTAHFPAIAEKLGDEFTVSALSNKWQRLKAEVEKSGGLSFSAAQGKAPAPSTPKKTPGKGRKRKAVTEDEGSEEPKPAKKAKAEAKVKVEEELEEGEVQSAPTPEPCPEF